MSNKHLEHTRTIIKKVMASVAIACLVFITSNTQSMDTHASETGSIVPIISLLLDEEPIDLTLPVANAGADFEVLIGELAQLDGSSSNEPTNLPITYLWSFITIPAGSVAMLSDTTLVNPSFVVDLPGSYVVQLVVNNGIKNSLPSMIRVNNTNRAPIADAGTNSIVPLGQAVQLDGGNSSDIDTDPLSYLWSISESPATSIATLADDTTQISEFTPDVKGTYKLDLVVNDGSTDSAVDQVEVLAGLELNLVVDDVFFGEGRNTTATLTLDLPAPPQGVVISLAVDDSTIIDLSETAITYTEGETEQTFTLTGLSAGITVIRAFATNIDEVSVGIEVSAALISIDEIAALSPSASTSAAISITEPAPVGGVTVNLETLDPAVATVAPTSLFIPEGAFVPSENAQVTGVGLGTTILKGTGLGFAPDERPIEVALAAAFDLAALNVPETLTRDIVLTLDAPAPVGGVSFDLTIVGDPLFSVQDTVVIEEGQTQSQPITLSGLLEGVATLRATAAGFIDADSVITVVDAPNVFLKRNGSNSHLPEAEIGIGLQVSYNLRLEIIPTGAVDIRVSVPENSGVLLSHSGTVVGSNVLLIEDVTNNNTLPKAFQGIALADDIPITIEVFEANSNTLAGYEALPSTVDVDPSGVYVTTSDFTTTTFTTSRTLGAQVGILYDDEHGALDGTFRQSQFAQAGNPLQVTMQVDDESVLTLPDGATGVLSINPNSTTGSIVVTPVTNGIATVSIASQPADFSLPSDRDDNIMITVVAPNAFVSNSPSGSHLAEAIVGLDLQRTQFIRLETAPPSPVDILVSVPISSGVLLSKQALLAGSSQILFEGVSSTNSSAYYLQGTALGDDVPITVAVYKSGTTDPAGFNVLASTADVDPSGIFMKTGDYNTTSFSANRLLFVESTVLYDAESLSNDGNKLFTQAIRGGLDLVVPMQVNDVAVARLPAGATDQLTISAGNFNNSISVEPISAGQAIVSIASLPGDFIIPSDRDDNTVVTVSAPNAFFRSATSGSHQVEATTGIDLQTRHYIRLAATPPAAVDIMVSVPIASGVLLSKDATISGTNSLLFEDISTTQSPLFYVQGMTLGDDVAVSIEVFEADTTTPIGYNVLASTIDVDPSGVYMSTGDYSTNTFAANRNITVSAALLYDDENIGLNGQRFTDQAVRGGLDLRVPMQVSDNTVTALPGGSIGTLTISSDQTNGSIELDPLTAGVATVSITAQPNANFTLPTNRDAEAVVTVTAPDARINLPTANVGDELQMPLNITLETAPPNPVNVTVEVIAPGVAVISEDSTTAGGATVTFTNVTGTTVGTIYLQGLTVNAATQMKVSAPGYNDDTADVNVVTSGFSISGNFSSTISVGSIRNYTLKGSKLNANGTRISDQQVRGGASFDIVTTSSLPGVGAVTSPVTLSGGDSTTTTTFTALAAGTTTIEITQPPGFTPPVGLTDGDITVE